MSAPSSASATVDAPGLLTAHGQAVESFLRSVLAADQASPPRLLEAIEYSLMAGGKRLRPALVLETARACAGRTRLGTESKAVGTQRVSGNGSPAHQDIDPSSAALAAAGAVELIHTFSLVHDDLPAMDDDDLRRGRPTNHRVFGEAMAILAGDAMVMMAFEVLITHGGSKLGPRLVVELARAAGTGGMIGGQVLDIDGEKQTLTLEQLRHVHRMKTGALLVASCRMGAIATGAGEEALRAVTDFGTHLGLAFQIVDDVLDVTSTPEQLGKATGKDAARGKNTYPSLMGLEPSRREADAQLSAALNALQRFGAAAHGLRNLAQFVVSRQI